MRFCPGYGNYTAYYNNDNNNAAHCNMALITMKTYTKGATEQFNKVGIQLCPGYGIYTTYNKATKTT